MQMLGTLSFECTEVHGKMLFVDAHVNGQEVLVMMDIGTTNTFLFDQMMK